MSEIRATTISDAAGTGPITLTKQSAAKAWVFADVDTAIVNSFNFSSGTDLGTGNYRFSFTNNMSGTDLYSAVSTPISGIQSTSVVNSKNAGNFIVEVFDDSTQTNRKTHDVPQLKRPPFLKST